MEVVTARIEDEYLKDLKRIEKEEQIDRAEAIRRLLARAIKDWKIERTLELIRKRKLTIRKAAEFVGVSYMEMLDLIAKADIDIGYGMADLRKDMER